MNLTYPLPDPAALWRRLVRATMVFLRKGSGEVARMSSLPLALMFSLFIGVPQIASAADDDAAEQLEIFIRSIDTFSADFQQTLYGEDSEPLQTSKGSVLLKRPGRFVWRYTEPASQEIVADGTRIWLYDLELEQVTVNAIDERLAGTPLVLLMGNAPLTESFKIVALGEEEGVSWLELTPLSGSSDFETVFIGLENDVLSAMELRDNFGQATQIRFSNFKSGFPVDNQTFEFQVPAGVDVIGAEGN